MSNATTPRLLDVNQAAAYLGISTWTLREMVADKLVHPVRMPSTRRQGEVSRRLLFDRADLDALVEAWKAVPR